MTSDESIFVIKREIQITISVINEEMLNAKWIDDIKVNLGDQIIMMKEMLYVFELNANLFFISIFNRRGFVVTFNEKIVEIKNKDILIVIEIVKGRMYMLQSVSTAFLNSEAKIPEKLEETIIFDIIFDGANDRIFEKKENITSEKKGQDITFEKKGQIIFRL